MRCLSDVMNGYFNEPTKSNTILQEASGVPISPSSCSWVIHTSPERFYREYTFQSKRQIVAFIEEILRYETEVNHSGTQKIDDLTVSIEVYTHNINRITELDQEYIKHVDFIYKDVLDFGL